VGDIIWAKAETYVAFPVIENQVNPDVEPLISTGWWIRPCQPIYGAIDYGLELKSVLIVVG
jgi:hypothetical protein